MQISQDTNFPPYPWTHLRHAWQVAKRIHLLAVWLGAIGGLLLAIVIGVIFIVIFYVAQQTVFQGDGKNIFEGILLLIASFMITFLAFAMLKIKGYEEKWQAKLEASATQMVSLRPVLCYALLQQIGSSLYTHVFDVTASSPMLMPHLLKGFAAISFVRAWIAWRSWAADG